MNDVGQYRCTSENKLDRIEKVIRIEIFGRYRLVMNKMLLRVLSFKVSRCQVGLKCDDLKGLIKLIGKKTVSF